MTEHPLPFSTRPTTCASRAVACAALLLTSASNQARDEAAQIGAREQLTPTAHAEVATRSNFQVGHPELGEINLVQRQPKPDTFTLFTNQLFSYTNNAFLRPDDEQSSLIWNGRLAAVWVPYSTRGFTPSISFEQNFFRFDKFPGLDFDTQTITGAAKFDLTKDGRWFTTTSGSVNRLYTSRFDAGDFYKFALISESITLVRQLGKSPVYTGTTFGVNGRLGNPSTFDRYSLFLNGAALWSPKDTIQLVAFVRPEVHFFTNHNGGSDHHGDSALVERANTPTDFNLSAGLAVTWTPIKSFSVSANFLWTKSWSTYGPHQYNVYTPSVGLTASIAF